MTQLREIRQAGRGRAEKREGPSRAPLGGVQFAMSLGHLVVVLGKMLGI